MKEYIHYGCTEFKKEFFNPIKNRKFIKPNGGFWASPVDSERGWYSWCTDNDMTSWLNGGSFKFSLTNNAKVYHIYSLDDLYTLPRNKTVRPVFNEYFIDFEACVRSGMDAIELHLSEEVGNHDGFMNGLYWELYGWDVDSILIFNPDIIVVEGE